MVSPWKNINLQGLSLGSISASRRSSDILVAEDVAQLAAKNARNQDIPHAWCCTS